MLVEDGIYLGDILLCVCICNLYIYLYHTEWH